LTQRKPPAAATANTPFVTPAVRAMESRMYERILVPVDGSPPSNRGLDEAIRMARLAQGRLRLIHVVDELSFALSASALGGYAGEYLDLLRAGGKEILAAAKARAEAAGLQADTVLHDNFNGRLCDAVAEEAGRWDAQLVVIGSHGRRGVGRLLLGSDAEQILRSSPVPVLLVHDAPEGDKGGAAA
jgi:nucleotide-binding universal stress UspA family protein